MSSSKTIQHPIQTRESINRDNKKNQKAEDVQDRDWNDYSSSSSSDQSTSNDMHQIDDLDKLQHVNKKSHTFHNQPHESDKSLKPTHALSNHEKRRKSFERDDQIQRQQAVPESFQDQEDIPFEKQKKK